jgi:hypothetical protein
LDVGSSGEFHTIVQWICPIISGDMVLEFDPGGEMRSRITSDQHHVNGRTAAAALERRIRELEQLATAQSRELRIQLERIAQLQAEWDILRSRLSKSRGGFAATHL